MDSEKVISYIGPLDGPLLVFGGPYSNLQSLLKLKQLADTAGFAPGHIICTGDVVGYCAQPEETVRLVQDWGIHCIAGNVELQLREGRSDCGCDFREGSRCDAFSRQWYPYARRQLSAGSIEWMNTLPDFIRFTYAGLEGLVVHGSWYETADYVFRSSPSWEKKLDHFRDTGADLILAGHCGLPFHQVGSGKYWLNPGVIGMPANDGTTRVWYMTLNMDSEGSPSFSHHAFRYDHEQAATLMEARNLPQAYAKTLRNGLWDNCEILPEAETGAQGVPVVF